ncbi:MAG: hypothetical protein LBR73_01680 [Oscillospiraceae bacterium]|jgi:hypothetical protein|nr:hypothetical protein [Oscillospiraceae bacterium]
MLEFLLSLLMCFQMLFMNVGYGWPWCSPTAEPEIVSSAAALPAENAGPLQATVEYAAAAQNAPQTFYTDADRGTYIAKNRTMRLEQQLGVFSGKTASLKTADGAAYFTDTFDVFYTLDGKTRRTSAFSLTKGRINTIRLGVYYNEVRVRDLDFGAGDAFFADKGYHVYADKLHQEYVLLAKQTGKAPEAFGVEIKIPKASVADYKYEPDEYALFDIKASGVVGILMPYDGSGGSLTLTEDAWNFLLTQTTTAGAGQSMNKYDGTGGCVLNELRLGSRIYTDESHDFTAALTAAAQERAPLAGITVQAGNSGARFMGYDPIRGTYNIAMNGSDFNRAYQNPSERLEAPVTVTAADGRDIMFRAYESNGALEAAVLFDANGDVAPIPVEVCKNFHGDGGEPYYNPGAEKDYAYGDAFFPLRLSAGETARFTIAHLYQNWGAQPLKQLSSIEFHVSYYHLSTGVTESNCIAPYHVYNRDGWILPDFRGRSGTMWSSQPQFNSVGRPILPTYSVFPGITRTAEYLGSRIDSVGLSHADITTYYRSDCGSYDFTLRHLEFPQTDENRTYYTLTLTFNRDMAFENFARDFSLFSFESRVDDFGKYAYTDTDGNTVIRAQDLSKSAAEIIPLGQDSPFFSYFDLQKAEGSPAEFGASFALIVKDGLITQNGSINTEPQFAFKNTYDLYDNRGALTLNLGRTAFFKGDTIKVNFILLPYGTGFEQTPDNAEAVRADSCLNPVTVTDALYENWLPMVLAENNQAAFTITGGSGRTAVVIKGLSSPAMPTVECDTGSGFQPVSITSAHGDDGYTPTYDPILGTYSIALTLDYAQGAAYRITQ